MQGQLPAHICLLHEPANAESGGCAGPRAVLDPEALCHSCNNQLKGDGVFYQNGARACATPCGSVSVMLGGPKWSG